MTWFKPKPAYALMVDGRWSATFRTRESAEAAVNQLRFYCDMTMTPSKLEIADVRIPWHAGCCTEPTDNRVITLLMFGHNWYDGNDRSRLGYVP
jgi:hypothetical protein